LVSDGSTVSGGSRVVAKRDLHEFLVDQGIAVSLLRRELESARTRREEAESKVPPRNQVWSQPYRIDPSVLVFDALARTARAIEDEHLALYRSWVAWWADTATLALRTVAHGSPVDPARIALAGPGGAELDRDVLARFGFLPVSRSDDGQLETLHTDHIRTRLWGPEWVEDGLPALFGPGELDRALSVLERNATWTRHDSEPIRRSHQLLVDSRQGRTRVLELMDAGYGEYSHEVRVSRTSWDRRFTWAADHAEAVTRALHRFTSLFTPYYDRGRTEK
jgi:hypothetical protein